MSASEEQVRSIWAFFCKVSGFYYEDNCFAYIPWKVRNKLYRAIFEQTQANSKSKKKK